MQAAYCRLGALDGCNRLSLHLQQVRSLTVICCAWLSSGHPLSSRARAWAVAVLQGGQAEQSAGDTAAAPQHAASPARQPAVASSATPAQQRSQAQCGCNLFCCLASCRQLAAKCHPILITPVLLSCCSPSPASDLSQKSTNPVQPCSHVRSRPALTPRPAPAQRGSVAAAVQGGPQLVLSRPGLQLPAFWRWCSLHCP